MFSVSPIEDTLLGGKYLVCKGDNVLSLLSRVHLDPEVYDEPLEFKPERMLDENFNKLPKNAWKPFGTGVRAVGMLYLTLNLGRLTFEIVHWPTVRMAGGYPGHGHYIPKFRPIP